MSPLDKVLDKLSKLKASREGEAAIGNAEAADAFAQMINSLLLKHELSEVDIPLRADEDPIIEVCIRPQDHGIKFSRVRVGWQETLAYFVAEAHLCSRLVTPRTNYITFIGTKAHATVAEYAYVVLVNAAEKMSRKARDVYWKEHRNDEDFTSGNFRAAWLSGFVGRMAERFAEQRRREVQATGNTSTALIRLDQALVRAKNYVTAKYTNKAAATKQPPRGCWQGHYEGRKAADGVPLGRKGVEGKEVKQVR